MIFLSLSVFIITKDIFFIIISIILSLIFFKDKIIFITKNRITKSNLEVRDGLIISDKWVKGVLVVDDIPFDYRDLSNESIKSKINTFYKITSSFKNIDIIFKKINIDQNDYMTKLLNKAQNLRIILSSDPSNEKAKKELDVIQAIISRIAEGESPFKYGIYFLITENNEESARAAINLLKKGLESLGIKSKIASKNEIYAILGFNIGYTEKTALPSQIPFLTPFSIPKSPKFELIRDGIDLGVNLESNVNIFWNIHESQNQHVLVIGPTGSGKTEFLISIALKLSLLYNIKTIIFDIKGDIKYRFKNRNLPYKIYSPFLYNLGLLKKGDLLPEIKALQIERILVNSFKLHKYHSSVFFKAIRDMLSNENYRKVVSWDDVMERIKELVSENDEIIYFSKIIDNIKVFDNNSFDNLIDSLDSKINIIDLTLIKSEDLRRFIVYSIITELYNRYSKIPDDKPKVLLVIDEAWTVLKNEDEDYPIIADLVKRGRGYGISIAMASQNIEDLGELSNIYLNNVGLLVVMNNGDKKFWNEIKRFVNISDEVIDRELAFLQRGEALIRFLGDPRAIIIRTNILSTNSL
jgi:hypothetical protein